MLFHVYSDSAFKLCRGKKLTVSTSSVVSKPTLLNLILLNLIVRWPTGAAIVRPPNTECTQYKSLLGKVTQKIENSITAFGHGIFFTVWSSQYFQNIYRQKK